MDYVEDYAKKNETKQGGRWYPLQMDESGMIVNETALQTVVIDLTNIKLWYSNVTATRTIGV